MGKSFAVEHVAHANAALAAGNECVCGAVSQIGANAKSAAEEQLLQTVREQKRTILELTDKVATLESYLRCMVSLTAKVNELEQDAQ